MHGIDYDVLFEHLIHCRIKRLDNHVILCLLIYLNCIKFKLWRHEFLFHMHACQTFYFPLWNFFRTFWYFLKNRITGWHLVGYSSWKIREVGEFYVEYCEVGNISLQLETFERSEKKRKPEQLSNIRVNFKTWCWTLLLSNSSIFQQHFSTTMVSW